MELTIQNSSKDMQVKALVALFTIFIQATSARRCRTLPPRPPPPVMSILYDLPSECGVQRQFYDDILPTGTMLPSMLDCGYVRPMCGYDGPMLPTMLDFGCVKPRCNDRLMLPPMSDCGYVRPGYYNEMLLPILEYGYDRPICYDGPMLPTMLERGYDRPMCYDGSMLPTMLERGYDRTLCNEALVLPPMRVELPRDLGYFPSAVPLVSSSFSPAVEVRVCAGASVPVTSPCSCLTLATPVSPDIAPLVRSVIL